jgi:hypothetical protein
VETLDPCMPRVTLAAGSDVERTQGGEPMVQLQTSGWSAARLDATPLCLQVCGGGGGWVV